MKEPAFDYEVAIIGGGPAGSSSAAALARRGHRVVLFEKDEFPRFHIGESLLPWSNDVFEALGVAERVARAGFVQKWGASFTSGDGVTEQYADFSMAPETRQAQTYQVPRAEFDRLLLDHAEASGAVVRRRQRVERVTFDAQGVTLATLDREGTRSEVRVQAVVDASGRAGLVSRSFGRREVDPLLRNIAVHAQFEGVRRREGRRAGDIQMVTRPDRGWFWFIPLTDRITSVGAVIPRAVHRERECLSPEESLEAYVAEIPAAAHIMAGSARLSPARFDADYSYLHTQHAGDRFVLVGDAGGFLDPIFSTGVILAMQGGLDAASALSAGLRAGDLSRARFRAYERRVTRRYRHFRRFAVGFYDASFRDLWFQKGAHGIYRAVLTVLAGNWDPSLKTRFLVQVFFGLAWLNRFLPIAPRTHARQGSALPAAAGTPERRAARP